MVNLEAAKSLWHSSPTDSIKVDFIHLDSTTAECEQVFASKIPEFVDIVICSGHLTRAVLNSVFEAQQVLSHLWRGGVNAIFSAGYEEELYSAQIVKKIGYDLICNARPSFRYNYQVNILIRHNHCHAIDEIKKAFEFQRVCSYLDLSLTPNPIQALRQLVRSPTHPVCSKIECIDFSFCDLKRWNLDELLALLTFLSRLKEIVFISNSKPEIDYVLKTLDTHYDVHTILVNDERLTTLPMDAYIKMDPNDNFLSPEILNARKRCAPISASLKALEPIPATKDSSKSSGTVSKVSTTHSTLSPTNLYSDHGGLSFFSRLSSLEKVKLDYSGSQLSAAKIDEIHALLDNVKIDKSKAQYLSLALPPELVEEEKLLLSFLKHAPTARSIQQLIKKTLEYYPNGATSRVNCLMEYLSGTQQAYTIQFNRSF